MQAIHCCRPKLNQAPSFGSEAVSKDLDEVAATSTDQYSSRQTGELAAPVEIPPISNAITTESIKISGE